MPFPWYRPLPVLASKQEVAKNLCKIGRSTEYCTFWVTNFHPFRSISYHFRDISQFLFERRNTKWRKISVKLVYTQNGIPFGSQIFFVFRSISYRFRDIGHFLFECRNRKWRKISVKLIYTWNSIPFGSQIFVVFALSFTVSEIYWPLSVWASKQDVRKNFCKIGIYME